MPTFDKHYTTRDSKISCVAISINLQRIPRNIMNSFQGELPKILRMLCIFVSVEAEFSLKKDSIAKCRSTIRTEAQRDMFGIFL